MRNHHLFQPKVSWVNLRQGWVAGKGESTFNLPQPLLLQPGLLPALGLRGVGVYLASAYSLSPGLRCWPVPAVTQVFLAPFADILQPVCLFRFVLFCWPGAYLWPWKFDWAAQRPWASLLIPYPYSADLQNKGLLRESWLFELWFGCFKMWCWIFVHHSAFSVEELNVFNIEYITFL